jgi:hypothetical protein
VEGMITGKEDIHPGTEITGIVITRVITPGQVTGVTLFFQEALYLFILEAIHIIITAVCFTAITMVFMNPYMLRLVFA